MLETKRLILRLPDLKDAEFLFELNSDPEVIRYTGDSSFNTITEAHALIRDRMLPQFEKYKMTRLLVEEKAGPLVGWCGLKYFPETNEVDLGYRFMKRHWGKGYATEASVACLEYGFNQLNLKRIIAKAMPENTASIKVMQKLGMTFRGYEHDPTDPVPFVVFDLKQEEFRKCGGS